MSGRLKLESIQFTTGSQVRSSASRPEPDAPFKLLIMGNFQGAPAHSPAKPVLVDLDNFDQVLARLNVELHLPLDGPAAPPLSLSFQSLDDFHPDQILEKIAWFGNIQALKKQLQNPQTFESAAAQVPSLIGKEPDAGSSHLPASAPSPQPAQTESTDGMMERLLGKPAGGNLQPEPQPTSRPVDQLLREAVKSSIVPDAHPSQEVYLQALDSAMTDRMSAILHHPDFQALESAWRGLDFLIKNIELDENLRLYLLNLSKETLVQDLSQTDDLSACHFYQTIVQPTVDVAGGQPWSVWMGNYSFGIGEEDAGLLAAMAKLGQAAGAPFLAGMSPEVIHRWTGTNPPSSEELKHWTALRKLSESSMVGLAWPRFLLRLPYGCHTDPIDSFDYEEIPGSPDPGRYLWGNPAFALTCLLGQSFSQSEWDLADNLLHELNGLPLHVYKEDGESKMTPCAEVWLNDQNSEVLLENGLIPMQSVQRRDAILIPRFQSIHSPATALGQQWS